MIDLMESRALRFALQPTRFAERVVRLLVFAALAVLEPFVRFFLVTLATLGMFVTVVFGFLIAADGFPKWTMLGMSVGCFLLLGAYYSLMSILGSPGTTREL